MEEPKMEYSNNDITIVWKPNTCIHSTICWKGATGLINVFNPKERPWIKPEGATTEEIIKQVKACPSGALSFYYNKDRDKIKPTETIVGNIITPTPNGPLIIHGNIVVKNVDGTETLKTNATSFCRCGGSSNKPYCDGTHKKNGFQG